MCCPRFTEANIPGGYANPTKDSDAKGPYVRMLKDLDVSADGQQIVLNLLESVLSDLHVSITVDGLDEEEDDDEEESDVAAFIKLLRARANLHFSSAGA